MVHIQNDVNLYNGKLLEKEKRNHKQGYVKVHFI